MIGGLLRLTVEICVVLTVFVFFDVVKISEIQKFFSQDNQTFLSYSKNQRYPYEKNIFYKKNIYQHKNMRLKNKFDNLLYRR
ncbi:hypothetical protein AB834_03940 [PVC group bacterium (ex Bugula neritina AB1)]|nr:hypothetical protein AB834_03940 [PVC group bacterium (ex Bugula neritina AB1)]